jgi:hypothetical protein
MVRTISTSISSRAHNHPLLAEGARSAVTAQSRSATTVLSVKGMDSVLTILYQSVVGLIGSRERVLVALGRPMTMNLPQGAGVAVPQQLTKQRVGLMV